MLKAILKKGIFICLGIAAFALVVAPIASAKTTKLRSGMIIAAGKNVYYIGADYKLRPVTAAGFKANSFRFGAIIKLKQLQLKGWSIGNKITGYEQKIAWKKMDAAPVTSPANPPPQVSINTPSAPTPATPPITAPVTSVATPPVTTLPTSPAPSPAPSATVPASGKIYYLATNGNDNSDGSSSAPWASPNFAAAKLKPGDTLIIKTGTYVISDFEKIIKPPSGAADNYIIIKGEDGAKPVLAAENNLLTVFDLSNTSYVKIANLEIKSNNGALARDGIEALGGPADNIILENLYIHNLDEFGINIGDTNNLQILNSMISYAGFGAVGGPAGTRGGWRNVKLIGDTLSYSGHYYQGKNELGPYDRPDGFGIEPSAGPIEIANTLSEHNRGDGLDSKAQNTWIHDSVVANNSCDGVKLWGTNARVENTTIYGRGDGNPEITPWSDIVFHDQKSNDSLTLDHVTVDDSLGGNYLMHVNYDYPNVPASVVIKNSIFSSRGNSAPIYFAPAVSYDITGSTFYFPNSNNVVEAGNNSFSSAQIAQLGAGNIYKDPQLKF